MKLKLVKKQPVARNTIMFWFEPDAPLHQIAGQYIELYLPHEPTDERKTKRWFTLSSSPTEKLLAITTKLHPTRPSSFKNSLNNLSIGEELTALPPMGDFILPKDKSIPLVFIAGGIGITPYRSILKYLEDTHEKRDIELIYAVNSLEDMAFLDLIERNASKFITHIGELNAKDVLRNIGEIADKQIYVSGPEKLVETLQKDLLKAGISELQLRVDFFHNYD